MRRAPRYLLIFCVLALGLTLLAACAQAATPMTVKTTAPTQQVAESPSTAEKATATAAPLPTQAVVSPQATQAVPQPTQILPQPTTSIEQRVVELEYPPRMRLGDSDVVRLSLIPYKNGYIVTTEFEEHQTLTQTVQVPRPGGYELSALARLDGVGFEIAPVGDQEQYLPPDQTLAWRWSLRPTAPGQQRLTIILRLRWTPVTGANAAGRETTAYSRSLNVQVVSFFGLTRGQAMTGGLVGTLFGGGLSLFSLVLLTRPGHSALKTLAENLNLILEPRPGMSITYPEAQLLRTLFRRYSRLVVESEFLSGYSGARTFLAQPIRTDGRADAYTIIKIGGRDSIQREFENYETYVKDTLPPITARIQHAPVTVRGSEKAALQYTFIAEPGRMPTSLRLALLENPDPALLVKLFETFGPNWWMQRRPYTFRLAQEYDRVLPTHYVLQPVNGSGRVLDGRRPPAEVSLEMGEQVTLRNFGIAERRLDGKSLSLRGQPANGQPPLRLRWLGLGDPNGAAGRVVAARATLLADFVSGLSLFGLPDPLQRLPELLNGTLSGTQSVIHGDLNLENILIGLGDFVWLIDFAQTRDGHTLFDFAHLEAEIIAHILAPRADSPAQFLHDLRSVIPLFPSTTPSAPYALLSTLHTIASRCLFNPSQPREYTLALTLTCLGALKFTNLSQHQRHLLYLTAAYLAQGL